MNHTGRVLTGGRGQAAFRSTGSRVSVLAAGVALLFAIGCAPSVAGTPGKGRAEQSGAVPSPPGEFFGLIAANDPDQTELSRMAAGRVGTLRINLVWGAVQSGPAATLDWTHYDELIGNAAKVGIRVQATVYGSPPWSAVHDYYPPSSRTWGDYTNFVRAAAARYGNTGTFWAEHPEIPRVPVQNWQFWNEPNLQGFWLPKLSAADYVRLLRVFSGAVRTGDPAGHVLLAGLFPSPTAHGSVIGVPIERYLPQIYSQRGARSLFDGVDIHPYARTPQRILPEIARTRSIMARFKDRRTPIWLGEVGWTTGGDPSAVKVTPARQAAYLTRTFQLLAANRLRYRIAGAIWYSWRDLPGRAWFNHTGLFTQTLDPKPAWNAFVGLTGGSAG